MIGYHPIIYVIYGSAANEISSLSPIEYGVTECSSISSSISKPPLAMKSRRRRSALAETWNGRTVVPTLRVSRKLRAFDLSRGGDKF